MGPNTTAMPQYFDLAGHKVMPTRCEDQARDLFHRKVTLIMLQVETVSVVDLTEGRRGEFVLDHAHLHLLDKIQSWCDEDMSDDHPEVTRTQQPDGTWSLMADRVIQLILKVLDLLPHTSMIQMGDEGMALSTGILAAEPPVMILVTTATDGVPTVAVQADPGKPQSDSNLLREERGPKTMPVEAQGQDKQTPAEEEVQQTGEDAMEEEPVKKAKKPKRKATKKKTAKAAKRVWKLSSSEESREAPSPEPVASGSGAATGKAAPATGETAAVKGSLKPRSPLPFHDEELEEAPAEMPDLETEQEAAAAQQRSQPTPEVQWEEVSAQQEKDNLDKLHEIWRLANHAHATAWQDNQIFTVIPEEGMSVDWRPARRCWQRTWSPSAKRWAS